MPILRLAGKASIRRRPVNSALGHASMSAQASPPAAASSSARWGTRPSKPPHRLFFKASARRFGPAHRSSSLPDSRRFAPTSNGNQSVRLSVSSGWRFAPACCAAQSVQGCAAHGWPARLAAAVQAAHEQRSERPALSAKLFVRRAVRSTWPNLSFNRSANGWPPCPRGAVCLSCASRARRPSVVARLTLR